VRAEKETEGMTLVSMRHSALQFRLCPYSRPQFPLGPYTVSQKGFPHSASRPARSLFSAAIAVSSVAAGVLFGFSDGLQSLVRLAALIQCGKHQIGIH
jgi:hypothetical protein